MQTSTQTDKMPSRNENHNHLTTSIAPTPTPATAPKFTKFKQKKWTSAKKAKLATKKDEYTHRPFFPFFFLFVCEQPKKVDRNTLSKLNYKLCDLLIVFLFIRFDFILNFFSLALFLRNAVCVYFVDSIYLFFALRLLLFLRWLVSALREIDIHTRTTVEKILT